VEEMRFATHFSSKSSLHRAFIADGKAELVRNIEGITLTVGKMVDP
jgi:hypothetical protein